MGRALPVVCLISTLAACQEPTANQIDELTARARQGDAAAQYSVGEYYYRQPRTKDSLDSAHEWFVPSALQEFPQARTRLRQMAEQGHDGAQVFLGYSAPLGSEEAMKWYGLAAEQGRVVALVALADMHYDQLREDDDSKAAWWYLKAVDRCTSGEELTGNDQAACKSDLDECLSRLGRISSQDKAAAATRFRLAASHGNRWAQGLLANMYMSGSGVAQDYVEAVAWYRLAAEQGDADAQYNLGLAHYHGYGVPQDYMEAAKWWRFAAEQGEATAQYKLALVYGLGTGVPQDDVQAHTWVNLAASRTIGEDAERYAKLRSAAAAQMTPAQIAEAQRLAREWKPKTWRDLNPE